MIIPETDLKSKMFSIFSQPNKKRIFLDYASTTPTDERVLSEMHKVEKFFANPSALYKEGAAAGCILEESREMVAEVLSCKPREVIFTGSGTESCNLALRGMISNPKDSHIITTAIEHPAVLESCRALESAGASVTYIKVDESGVVSVQDVLDAIRPETRLVSIMYVNNEIGTVQPIRKIGVEIEKINRERDELIYFHSDASQAPCYFSIQPEALKVSALTLDGSKIYGPKGVGVLFSRSGFKISPIVYGGGQEFGLRSGTESNVLIRGMAEALHLAVQLMPQEVNRIKVLRNELLEKLISIAPSISVNGELEKRSPHIANICIPEADSEFLVMRMDALGVACSSASSCKARHRGVGSHVLEAIGKRKCASSSLRFSLGRYTTAEDVTLASELFRKALSS